MVDHLIPFPNPESVKSTRLAANVILIIGESASRNHHSLYGYGINTNPFLTSIKDSLFIFTDAIGSSASTASNMERILTFKEDDQTDNDWFEYPGIIDLFNNAHYKTYYLSNQEKIGFVSNASGALAASANVVKYISSIVGEDALSHKFDEELIPEVESALKDSASSKFIITHLYGSHAQYKSRFPQNFERVTARDILSSNKNKPWLNNKKAQIIADYDNSIAYTDSILYECITMVCSLKDPSLLIYFSDHGEHVYDTRDFIGRDEKFVEVPFIIYTNNAYASTYPDMIQHLKSAEDYPISTANIIYSLMTLTGTTYPLYNPKNDFLSSQYEPHHRNVDNHPWKYD
jgi:Predicted membrane-associated, metal-dependent hydrolase